MLDVGAGGALSGCAPIKSQLSPASITHSWLPPGPAFMFGPAGLGL